MRIKKWILGAALLPTAISALSSSALAGDAPPKIKAPQLVVRQKHVLPNAIRIQITNRGMKYFENNMSGLLENMGISIDEGFFPGTTWQSDRSYRLSDLGLPTEQQQTLNMVTNMLSKWLVGWSLKDTRPTVQIGNTGYTAQFSRFALVTDEKLLNTLGKTDGAVLAIEFEIKNMTVAAESLRAADMNNPRLGQVGADAISLQIAHTGPSLKIRLPFYVRINPMTGQPELQALQISNNIAQVNMTLKAQKLISPPVTVTINGYSYDMDKTALDKEFSDHLPEIVDQVKKFMGDFANRQLPQMLNDEIKQALTGSLEEVNKMTPPGADDDSFDAKNPLLWGLQVGSLNMRGALQLGLNAFVEDPLRPTTPTLPALGARGLPNVNVVSPDSYDIALAIDRGFINRTLQLSFNRGVFSKIPMDGGLIAKLTQIPTMDYVDPNTVPNYGTIPGENSTLLRLKTKILVPKGMLENFSEKMALKEPFELSLDVIGKMIQTQAGDLKIMYWDVDPASVGIEDKYLTMIGSMFRGKVEKGLREKMATMAKDWRSTGKVLANSFPIPQEILGIKLETQKVTFDRNGYILLYMNYAPVSLMNQTKSTTGGAK